jgi:hypothetical protein
MHAPWARVLARRRFDLCARRSTFAPMFSAMGLFVSNLAAAFAGGPDWLSGQVLICAIAAVVLLLLALLLRGLQKIVMLLVAIALVAGTGWLIRDALAERGKILPPELALEIEGLANRVLESPAAKSAWAAIESELPRVTGDLRDRLLAGGDQARKAIANRLDAKAVELRAAGRREAAEELMRLKAKIAP